MEDNILLPSTQNEEEEFAEVSLRPKFLKEYIGQTKVSVETRWKEHLRHAQYGD